MSLYNKYRPQSLDEMLGDYGYIKDLLANPACNHAFLFYGGTGRGKSLASFIVAKMLGATEFDIEAINFADDRGIETVRDMIATSKYSFGIKVYILSEVQRITAAAQDALLDLIEFAPDKVWFLLNTNEPEKLKPTLRDRCQRINMLPISVEDLEWLVKDVSTKEGNPVKNSVASSIAEASEGSARAALTLLESVLAFGTTAEQLSYLENHGPIAQDAPEMIELCRKLFGGAAWKETAAILTTFKKNKVDGEGLRRVLLGYASTMCLSEPSWFPAVEILSKNVYDSGINGVIGMCAKIHKGG